MQQSRQPPLTQPKLLLVEGQDEINFFSALIKHLNLQEIEVRDYGGKTQLSPYLRTTLKLITGFQNIKSVGVVRDADDDAIAAFQSVHHALLRADLPAPEQPLVPVSGPPQMTVMIMPPDADMGMLEDLCLQAFQADAAMQCVDRYFECIQNQMQVLPRNLAKARIHVFLASKEPPDLRLGQAVSKDFWTWDSPAFDTIKAFMGQL